MDIVKELGQQIGSSGKMYRFSIFKCPVCNLNVKKVRKDGVHAKCCSHKCYAKTRQKRGPYNPSKKIVSKKYIYCYMPEHPNAIGTKKLYIAEHRLVMEKKIGRYLTKDEVVHHRDGNTINNRPSNLQLMTLSEHNKHHANERKRNKQGKFR